MNGTSFIINLVALSYQAFKSTVLNIVMSSLPYTHAYWSQLPNLIVLEFAFWFLASDTSAKTETTLWVIIPLSFNYHIKLYFLYAGSFEYGANPKYPSNELVYATTVSIPAIKNV